jgi:hypothetical protein
MVALNRTSGSETKAAKPSVGIVALRSELTTVSQTEVEQQLQTSLRLAGYPSTESKLTAASLAAWVKDASGVDTAVVCRQITSDIEQAWRAYLAVSTDAAMAGLTESVRAAVAQSTAPCGFAALADASLRLGIVSASGPTIVPPSEGSAAEPNIDAARLLGLRLIAFALRLEPTRTLSLSQFSPDALRLVEEVRSAAVNTVALTLQSSVTAKVVIDGAVVTKVEANQPLVIQVATGQHLIQVFDGLRRPTSRLFDVSSGGATFRWIAVPDSIGEALRHDATRYNSRRDAQEFVQAVLRVGVAQSMIIVVATWKRGEPALYAQRCELVDERGSNEAQCFTPVEVGWDGSKNGLPQACQALLEMLVSSKVPSALAILTEPAANAPAAAKTCRWCRSPVLWTGIAATMVGGVTAALLLSRTSDAKAPIVTLNPSDFGH